MAAENWVAVKGYEGYYEVSNKGRVRSLDRIVTMRNGKIRIVHGRVLREQYGNGQGNYSSVTLCKEGVNKRICVHRIVASAFIPNPDGLPEINHKDENKTNNCVENLEWCDRQHNNTYGTTKLRAAVTQGKPVLQLDIDGSIINGWPSMGLAACFTRASQSGISACCRGDAETSGGYRWRIAPWAQS